MISQLEWVEKDGEWIANSHGFEYRIYEHPDNQPRDNYWFITIVFGDRESSGFDIGTKETMKSLAQAHATAILSAIEQAKPKWISVEDTLPEKGKDVLLFDRSIGQVVGRLEYRTESETYWETYGGHTFTGPIGVNKNNPVTHWQPLPYAPEDK